MFANADAYERFMGRWSRLLAPLVLEFASIPDGWRILDLGSGTGSLAIEIAVRRPHSQIVGVEPSNDYVAYAKHRLSNPAVHFEVGDAQELPFATAEFDASLSLLVFNFIPDARKALAELRRVTRPGGCICAAVWDYGDRMQMLRTFWDAAMQLDANAHRADERHLPLCRAGELSSLWHETGLTNVGEQPLEVATVFSSFDDFWQPFLAGQGPAGAHVERLSAESLYAIA